MVRLADDILASGIARQKCQHFVSLPREEMITPLFDANPYDSLHLIAIFGMHKPLLERPSSRIAYWLHIQYFYCSQNLILFIFLSNSSFLLFFFCLPERPGENNKYLRYFHKKLPSIIKTTQEYWSIFFIFSILNVFFGQLNAFFVLVY